MSATLRVVVDGDPTVHASPAHGLTARELEVTTLVVDGATDREIAVVLGISERTARAHVEAARRKLAARSRTQLAVFAIRRGFVALELAS